MRLPHILSPHADPLDLMLLLLLLLLLMVEDVYRYRMSPNDDGAVLRGSQNTQVKACLDIASAARHPPRTIQQTGARAPTASWNVRSRRRVQHAKQTKPH